MLCTGLVGTYDSPKNRGPFEFFFDEEAKTLTSRPFFSCSGAKCVTFFKSYVVTVFEDKPAEKAGIILLDKKGNELSRFADEKVGACFITSDENFIYTANYHDGAVFIYTVKNEKIILVKKIFIQEGAGCHQALRHGNLLLIPCLLLDCLKLYDVENDYAPCGEITFKKGTGPRHGVFTSDDYFYLVSELSNELFCYHWPKGKEATLLTSLSYLPQKEEKKSSSAAIRLTSDEKYLYISTRGSDLLSSFSLKEHLPQLLDQKNCGGSHPRDFILAASEKYLLIANRLSNELIALAVSKGKIGAVCAKTAIPACIGIILA